MICVQVEGGEYETATDNENWGGILYWQTHYVSLVIGNYCGCLRDRLEILVATLSANLMQGVFWWNRIVALHNNTRAWERLSPIAFVLA